MTTIVRTTIDIDIDLIQAKWAYLHNTWEGDLVGAALVSIHIDELLDERSISTHARSRT